MDVLQLHHRQHIPLIDSIVFDKNIDKLGYFKKNLTVGLFGFYFGAKEHSRAINQVFSEGDLDIVHRKRLAQRTIDGLPNTISKSIPLIIELSKISSRSWGIMGLFYRYKPSNTPLNIND
jgi:hypothetical protein